MAYQAKMIEVVVASPSDCGKERQIVREVIEDWNASHSKARNLALIYKGWDVNSIPAQGDRPQAILNKQVLENCDILIATFWTRIGTPTGEAASGTAEEIDLIVKSGKPVMIYKSTQPVVLDSLDVKQVGELNQLVSEYKKTGIVEEYGDMDELYKKLSRQLATVINNEISAEPETESEHEGVRVEVEDVVLPAQADSVPGRMSADAKELLSEAVKDKSGNIMKISFIGGRQIITNGRNFISDRRPQTVAKWEAALDELLYDDLITPRGYKGEVFSVTHAGYQIVEYLNAKEGE